ncbi:MAG: V-type ATP synthase subunit D [Clostridiales bacterium]|jgi:V/A-type H+-transporting ATPase subunit D|nr:V-type ATP synthase subunit D [Clostridiales bacterium]
MARLAVNPTRMELRRLKDRLKTAARGHKLLKDKSDEMVRQFLGFVRENKRLREEIESDLSAALRRFMLAKSLFPTPDIEQTFSLPAVSLLIKSNVKNVMGVNVPDLRIEKLSDGTPLPYAMAATSGDMDDAVLGLSALLEKLLALAEIEKTCNMLADEIEKNRRRVNALEYIMIPQLNETIRYIVMKLDENERGDLTRLMKVKSMLEKGNGADK